MALAECPDPHVNYEADDGYWEVLEDWSCAVFEDFVIEVPAGFRFDLASIPKPLWSVIGPHELGISPVLVHDWLYQHKGLVVENVAHAGYEFTRANSDLIFRLLMEAEGVPWLRRWAAWLAVRLFGWLAWRS